MRAKLVLSRGRCSTGDEWMNEANGSLTSIAIKNLLKHFVLSGERHALPLSLVLNNCVCLDVRAFLNPGPLGSKFYQFFSEFSSLWNFFKKGFCFFFWAVEQIIPQLLFWVCVAYCTHFQHFFRAWHLEIFSFLPWGCWAFCVSQPPLMLSFSLKITVIITQLFSDQV